MRGECFHLGQCQRWEAGLELAWGWGSSSGFRGLCRLLCSGLFCSVLMADAFTLANVILGRVAGLGGGRVGNGLHEGAPAPQVSGGSV